MNEITVIEYVIYAVAGFVTTVFSGISGGGAGFIMTPLSIFIGLTPAQAVATGKFSGLSVSLGSLRSYHGSGSKSAGKRFTILLALAAIIVGMIAPFLIVQLDDRVYRIVLGLMILIMIPLIRRKKIGHQARKTTLKQKKVGWLLLIAALLVQGVFSGGSGVLVVLVLMSLFGLDSITAQITKRWSQVLLNTTVVIGVVISGLVVWPLAIIGVGTSYAGGLIGAKLAIRKGNEFVMNVFALLMLASGIGLMIT